MYVIGMSEFSGIIIERVTLVPSRAFLESTNYTRRVPKEGVKDRVKMGKRTDRSFLRRCIK